MRDFVKEYTGDYRLIARYIVAGSSGVVLNLTLVYIFTDIVGIWYLTSAVLAFSIQLIYLFLTQKYWTFKSKQREGIYMQGVWYTAVALFGLLINTTLLFLFVEHAGIWYLYAQVGSIGVTTFFSFILNKKITFRDEYYAFADYHTEN